MTNLRDLTRNFWTGLQRGVQRFWTKNKAPPAAAQTDPGQPGLVKRAFDALAPGGPSDRATAVLYDKVANEFTERYGPRAMALVPVLLARAEFEAGRGRKVASRTAVGEARSIMLAQWGRLHPLWPLVEARFEAISRPEKD